MSKDRSILLEFIRLTEIEDSQSAGAGGVDLTNLPKLQTAVDAMMTSLGAAGAKTKKPPKKPKTGESVSLEVPVGGGAKKYTVTITPPR